jgi:hypothetical protein
MKAPASAARVGPERVVAIWSAAAVESKTPSSRQQRGHQDGHPCKVLFPND